MLPALRTALALILVAEGAGTDHVYVQSAELNGKPLTKPELHHNELKAGGALHFKMGADPSGWGKEG